MKNALLVIDVQEYFINKYTNHLPRKIARFIRDNKFDYVLFFQFVNAKNSNWVRILKWDSMLDVKDAKIADELQEFITKDNLLVKRASFSVFRVGNFIKFLIKEKITCLYICGIDTDACVYTTTMEAFERGYKVKVISDLCADHHGMKHHKMAIELLQRNLGKEVVVTSGNISK